MASLTDTHTHSTYTANVQYGNEEATVFTQKI